MIVHVHRQFEKQYKKLPATTKSKAKARLQLFAVNPTDPILNNHGLRGTYANYYSINATGDMRMIYQLLDGETALFIKIGSHSELYG
jgi:addiction module RelE/StbE family toxin